jgi:ABC-2 type transport system permease protein
MTAVEPPPTRTFTATGAGPVTDRVTHRRVLQAEWTKLRSLHSSLYCLLATAAVTVGLAVGFAAADVSRWDQMTAQDRAKFDPTQICLFGIYLAQVAVGVLGVLTASSEYGTGLIRATLTAVPRRLPVLWAKTCVTAAATLTATVPATIAAFLLGQAILSRRQLNVSFTHPNTARAVIGAAGYLAVIAVLGLALGVILRGTAPAITTLTGILLVAPVLAGLLPGTWGHDITKYLPSNAGQAIMTMKSSSASLSPFVGLAVLCAYTAAALLAAAVLLNRRDA